MSGSVREGELWVKDKKGKRARRKTQPRPTDSNHATFNEAGAVDKRRVDVAAGSMSFARKGADPQGLGLM